MSAHRKEDWMNTKWRPAMGWSYMLTCIADFVVFPILWSLLQALDKGSVTIQWQPITLQGAGLYHIAMGAVLGVAAYGRTQEKLGGANNGFNTPTSGPATPGFPPASGFSSPGPSVNTGFGAPSGFNSNPGFGAPAHGSEQPAGADFGAPAGVTVGFRGKKAPPDLPQPLI
jgi:hypothetical protein